jgi:hypothetical protein
MCKFSGILFEEDLLGFFEEDLLDARLENGKTGLYDPF